MFKKTLIFITSFLIANILFAQRNITVDISDEVYAFLETAQQKGYCENLPYNKPYSVEFIQKKLFEIKDKIEWSDDYKFKENELKIVDFYLSRYENTLGFNWRKLAYRVEDDNEKNTISFEFNTTEELFLSSGLYDNKELNSTGFEFFHNFNFLGDIGKNLSYRSSAYLGITEMPLEKVGEDYLIGYWWYNNWKKEPEKNIKRTINTFRNNSVLPYSYKKKWDGSIYYLTNISYNGLEGWPVVPSFGFGMVGEIRGNFFDDKITLGFSRISREWGGMDNGSSLIYNSNTQPFVAIDAGVKLLDWLSFQTITGVLEFPNAGYINENAWYRVKDVDENGNPVRDTSYNAVDGYFFQNAFSMGMFNFETKYVHFDFGSTCVWPKRFELGYIFPLVDRVIYQNSVGDYDNLSLFANIKGKLPGIGSLWGSAYLEELSSFKMNMFKKTRCQFAYQFGTKANIPWLPFTTFSTRYTKVEPYCYTYVAFKNQPYYSEYITEPYSNNGRPIGYYLDPNSDELLLRIESKPLVAASIGLQYQMIRHGADYGSAQVPGSSIWSEFPIGDRNIYYKYFLHDGAYEWTHIIKLDASYNFNSLRLPFKVSASIGYIYDYFTVSQVVGTAENNYFANKSTPYHKIDNDEYPSKKGVVFTLGVKFFESDICQ